MHISGLTNAIQRKAKTKNLQLTETNQTARLGKYFPKEHKPRTETQQSGKMLLTASFGIPYKTLTMMILSIRLSV